MSYCKYISKLKIIFKLEVINYYETLQYNSCEFVILLILIWFIFSIIKNAVQKYYIGMVITY